MNGLSHISKLIKIVGVLFSLFLVGNSLSLSARTITFGDGTASTGWDDLGVKDALYKSEKAVYTVSDVTPSGELIFWLSIECPYLVRSINDELGVNAGAYSTYIDSRGWPAESNDEWIEFTLQVSGPGAADLTSLSLNELALSYTGNDMIEFNDGGGGSVLRYISDPNSTSSYGAGQRLEGLEPLALSNAGGVGDGTWVLRLTARAFGEVDISGITSFRVNTLKFDYDVSVPAVENALPMQDLLLHLDANSLIGTADGVALPGVWADLSGNANDADSATPPTFLADGGGGYPAVSFDGVDDYLEVPLPLGTEASVFVVFSNERSTLLADHSDTLLTATGTGSLMGLSSSKASVSVPDYPSFNAASDVGLENRNWVDGLETTAMTGEIFSGHYYLGTAVYSQMSSAGSLVIGASDVSGTNAGKNNIREIIIYDRALTDPERLEVEAYLDEKYRLGTRKHALDHPVESYPHIIGTQQFGYQYGFGESGIRGVDYARAILRQGTRVAKFRLSKRYDNVDGFTTVAGIDSLVELARDQPEIKQILDMPFTDYLFWVASFSVSDWTFHIDESGGGLIDSKRNQIYQEVYDLTVYLLETYSGTGKSFYLGNWEGDWKLAGPNRSDPTLIPEERIAAQIDWANARQEAVDDAKAATPHSDVNVWYYLEANKMDWAREGLPCVLNSVIPAMPKLDFISLSSYSLHKDSSLTASVESMHSDLDILQSRIDDKPDPSIPGSRLIIGEYGFQYSSGNFSTFEEFAQEHARTLRNFLSWQGGTLRFILQWQFFNNAEASSGASKEMCQISDQNEVRPLYYLHENFYHRMREWLNDYHASNGSLPSGREYSDQAVLQFDATLVQEHEPDVSPWPDEFVLSQSGFNIPEIVESVNQQPAGVVYDRYGQAILADAFNWSIGPLGQGVGIDASGDVSIQGNASPEEYTVSVSSNAFSDFAAQSTFRAVLPVASIYDELEDFSKAFEFSPDLTIETANAEVQFELDDDRLKRISSLESEGITWYVPDLNRFHAKIYHFNADDLSTKVEVESSPDGTTWSSVALRTDPPTQTDGNWNRSWIAPANTLPAGTNYLRLSLIYPDQVWNPQVGEVILFGAETGFSFWQLMEFTDPSDRDDPSIAGPAADPTQSGVSNLYRYFAEMPVETNDRSRLPQLINESGQIRYAIPYDGTKQDVLARVEVSDDLSNWDYTLFDSSSDIAVTEDGWLIVDAESLPLSDQYFFRLNLSL